MNIIKSVLFIAAMALPVTNTHALEWVDYDGTIPDNAVMVNEGVEDRPICRKNERIGLIKNDLCHSVKAGGNFDKKDIDDGYQILVDTYNAYEVAELDSKPEYGTWVFDQELQSLNPVSGESLESLCEGTFTHLFDDAVADATSGLIPPGDCGNSEEEAFKAGLAIAEFYGTQHHGSMNFEHTVKVSQSGLHESTSNYLIVDSIDEAMKDYLNGRCENVAEYIRDGVGSDFPLACQSFHCKSDGTASWNRGSYIRWSQLDEEVRETYCSNADSFE